MNEYFGVLALLSLFPTFGIPFFFWRYRRYRRRQGALRRFSLVFLPFQLVLFALPGLLLGNYCLTHWRNDERIQVGGSPRRWAEPVYAAGVPENFHRLSPQLYRSAQPTREQMQTLQKIGIRSIINLRSLHSDRDELAGTALREFRIKSVATDLSLEEVAEFLRVFRDPANLPALVHCQHGSDRTGTMCAFYRIVVEGWSREEAIAELTGGGFGFHFVYDRSIPELIRTADLAKLRQLAGYVSDAGDR